MKLIKTTFGFSLVLVMLLSCKKDLKFPNGLENISSLPNGSPTTLSQDWSVLMDRECTYIRNCQLVNAGIPASYGAIMNVPFAGNKINPYFANISAIALLERPSTQNLAAVKLWINWYVAHLNRSNAVVNHRPEVIGSIYDYYDANTNGVTTQHLYDSVDSYAATFLKLCKRLHEVYPTELAYLQGKAADINLVGDALEYCIDNSSKAAVPYLTLTNDDNDGLSFDSYEHGAKYMEDNAEVNEGLKAAVYLRTNVLTTGRTVAEWSTLLAANTSGMESQLWRATSNNYNWNDDNNYYVNANLPGCPTCSNTRPTVFYADGVCQLYAAMLGVISPTSARAISLYSDFNNNFPNWSPSTAGGTPYRYDRDVNNNPLFPHMEQVWAAAVMGDVTKTENYLTFVKNQGTTEPDRWLNSEAAFTIMACKTLMGGGTPPPPPPPSGGGTNLALNKVATAQSGTGINLAIDGDSTSTKWESASADNQWWKVDLGTTQAINQVVIFWYLTYSPSYNVQISTDNVSWTTVYSTTTGAGGKDIINFTSASARYVRVNCITRTNAAWPSSFYEVKVYGGGGGTPPPPPPPSGGGPNLALNKVATAQSGTGINLAIDGDSTSTKWESAAADNQWWKVDLGTTQAINQVVIFWYLTYSPSYDVQVSTDNVSWTTVYSTTTGAGGKDIINFIAASARYVRVNCKTRTNAAWPSSFYEVKVYGGTGGTPPPSGGGTVNQALNKMCTTSSGTGSLAVDGDATTTRWQGSTEDGQWWQVDLGSSLVIDKVVIIWEGSYAIQYNVEIATKLGGPWTTVKTETAGNGGTDTIPFTLQNARYVKVTCVTKIQPVWGASFFECQVF
jgi:hypothetical protein